MHAIIDPVPVFSPPAVATKLYIQSVTIHALGPNGSATIGWSLVSESLGVVSANVEKLSGAAYQSWSSDDSYILHWLASKLRITIVSIVDDTAPAQQDTSVLTPIR